MASQTDDVVQDGRLRVDNVELMNSKGVRNFNWLRIDANNNCNLKCTYCRVPRSDSNISEAVLSDFLNTKVASVVNLQFGCGMEPTLDPRLADLMLLASRTPAKPSGQFVVQTNGTLLHRHDHQKFNRAGLNRLSVSIDSLDPTVHRQQRGGSDVHQVIENLRQFQRHCPDVETQFICVVTSANIEGTLELARFAVEVGVKRMAFRQMVYIPNHPNVVEQDIVPLIVSNDEFYKMKDRVQNELEGALEMSFYDNDDLDQHRTAMRADSYYLKDADKPFFSEMIEHDETTDLLEGKKFFVLRGYMKSGTNWVSRLLNLHPQISCAGEFHWQTITAPFIKIIEDSNLLKQKEGLRHEMWKRLDRMMKECMVLANHPDAIWVGDRTPAHIAPSVVMDSKIFNVIRDGRDVLVSRAYHFFNNPNIFPKFAAMPENQKRLRAFKKDSQFFIKNPDELLACGSFVKESIYYWAETIHVNARETERLDPARVMIVRYEDLHQEIEGTRNKLYEFLDVEPSLAGPLAFNTRPGFEKEMPDQFLRKGAVGDWKNYMTPTSIDCINEIAGEALLDLGYIDSLDWGKTIVN